MQYQKLKYLYFVGNKDGLVDTKFVHKENDRKGIQRDNHNKR